MCILIIEDDAASRKLVRSILQSAGYEALEAPDALEGIRIAREAQPALVLMDIHLPGMDGLEATAILRADDATQDIKILALTAHAMLGDEERMIAAGCDGYLPKPVRYQDLLAKVDELLDTA